MKDVPEIRFKGFANPWVQRKLGEVIERIQGNDGRMNLPTLTISAGSGWLDQRERFSNNIAGKEQENYTLLSKGGLSYNKGNSKLAKYGVVFELKTYEEALVPRVYHSFNATKESNAAFLEYLFATKIPDSELAKLITSGARLDGLLNIGFEAFAGISINIPNKNEQDVIGNFFRTLDNTIALYKRRYNLLKQLKKAFLQQMFPQDGETIPKVRFAGFDGDWEVRKLGDMAEITMGQSPDSIYYTNNPKDNILVQGNADIKEGWVMPRVWTTQITKKAKKGDLILSVRAPVGDIGKTDYDVVLGRGVCGIKGNEFLFQQLGKMKNDGYWSKISSGSTFDSINSSDIKEALLLIPYEKEQIVISNFFCNLDKQIKAQQTKLENLKKLKSAYLQKMFV